MIVGQEDKPPLDEKTLEHFGILGMKWGIRKQRDNSSSITKRDIRWAKRRSEKITAKARKKSRRELSKFTKQIMRDPSLRTKSGQLSSAAVLAYNKKMAEIMTQKVSKLSSPSGKTIKFIAKRGQVGVFMALADRNYNMDEVRNGLFDSGKIGYRKKTIDQV